jgi:hypothetical protein
MHTRVIYFLAKLGPISDRTSDKRILEPLYIFEFPADRMLVRITAFRILAAAATPVFWKAMVKGDLECN